MSALVGVAPEPPSDSGRIVWGVFVLTAGTRERTRECSPRALGDSGRIIWGGFMLPAGEVSFRQRVHASAPTGVTPEPPGDSGGIAWGVLLAGVSVCTVVV